jgi:hypothetical protein
MEGTVSGALLVVAFVAVTVSAVFLAVKLLRATRRDSSHWSSGA